MTFRAFTFRLAIAVIACGTAGYIAEYATRPPFTMVCQFDGRGVLVTDCRPETRYEYWTRRAREKF